MLIATSPLGHTGGGKRGRERGEVKEEEKERLTLGGRGRLALCAFASKETKEDPIRRRRS